MALNPVEIRNDITILRAIAVISVVGFHFGIPLFGGGFIGVDIFFVISGYLISGVLIRDIESGKFNIVDFLTKRAFRLLPALMATIAITFIASFFILQPMEFKNNAKATISAVFFISNLYFHLTGGYFDAAPITKPLLHTWSLSVESQFYLIWPIVLIVSIRRKLPTIITIALFTVVFFLSSLYALDKNLSAAYLLTPFRIWELSIGGLFYLLQKSVINKNKKVSELIYATSLMIIVASILMMDEKMPFPGYYVLIPTLCTGLMLVFGEGSYIARALELKPIIHIGEISYSLYLIHWPVIVMVAYVLGERTIGAGLISIPISYLISLIMYHYVEQRYRSSWRGRNKKQLIFKYMSIATLIAALSTTAAFNGWIWRLPVDVQETNYKFDKKAESDYVWVNSNLLSKKELTDTGKINLVLIGDSQAADIINSILESKYGSNFNITSIQIDAKCGAPYVKPEDMDSFLEDVNPSTSSSYSLRNRCRYALENTFNDFNKKNIKTADFILIAMNWRPYSSKYINDTISEIESNKNNKKIIVIGKKSLKATGIFILNKNETIKNVDLFSKKYIDNGVIETNEKISSSLPKNVKFFNLMDIVCPEKEYCRIIDGEKNVTYSDETHFTKSGAELFSNDIVSRLGLIEK